jgi:alkylated DNA repair protein (DNA oxidative demethylase)
MNPSRDGNARMLDRSDPVKDPAVGIDLEEGVRLWRERISAVGQRSLIAEVFELSGAAPFYRPTMPRSERPFSVQETNFGPLGWYSDKVGYRYRATHPYTDQPWPRIPSSLLALWDALTCYRAPPECCLVNLYRGDARMGLHQDRDEADLAAPVLSVSLGDSAMFRFGGTQRRGPTRAVKLNSGDVVVFGGPARLMFHGIDRVLGGSSRLVPEGGRLNLTLRRVSKS